MEYSIWAVKIDEKTVRLDDLSIGFWEETVKDEPDGMMFRLLTSPMSRPEVARRMAVEAARLCGKDQPNLYIAGLTNSEYGEPSLSKLGDLFNPVESDLPEVGTGDDEDDDEAVDGVPSSGDDQLTSTSPS